MVPIVDIARIYALKYGILENNTQERLHQLYLEKKLRSETYNDHPVLSTQKNQLHSFCLHGGQRQGMAD
jgi:signal-transduction protein with cAMP-binding, CBS, and nucleotidyltransferase domain